MSNASHLRGSAQWIRFPRVVCQRWVHHNGRAPVVLMGDAAHTAHFSIGSGTKLALEDSIELARSIGQHPGDLAAALQHYEDLRSIEVLKIQNAARNSTEWFEHVDRYVNLPPEQFAYSLLTRSQRISHENLRLRDKGYVENYEDWIAAAAGKRARRAARTDSADAHAVHAARRDAEEPHRRLADGAVLGGRRRSRRLPPGAPRRAGDGRRGDGRRRDDLPERRRAHHARLPGPVEHDAQRDAFKRIVDFVHANSDAKIAMQLGHAGAKGSTRVPWEGEDLPLESGNWPLISASPQQYLDGVSDWSEAMTRADMDRVRDDFVRSTRFSAEAGFDWLELHCAHGYLLSSFISPLTNQRTDEYGGSLANRLRYPLEVFHAIREVWPKHLPISVRISAHDWVEGGITPDDAVEIARIFKAAGCDLIDCSSGQVSKLQKPVYGRMYQAPFADRIRNEAGIPTIAVGAISEADHVNSIIAAGRADLCAVARPHLANPAWTLLESARIGYTEVEWPKQYRSAKTQLERNLERERQMAAQGTGLSAIEQANRALGV